MKVDVRSIAGGIAGMAWVAVKSFAVTFLALSLAGCTLACLSWYFLREHGWQYAAAAATLAVVEGIAAGVLLGSKRAVTMAGTHGLGSLRLGGKLVSLLFDRMLGIAEGEFGERGGLAVRGLERLPLAQAEQLLAGAVRRVAGEAEQTGWVRRTLGRLLLGGVRKYTLARFREEGALHGGVDVLKLKTELEGGIDDAIVAKLRATLWIWTATALFALPLLAALQTWLIGMLAASAAPG